MILKMSVEAIKQGLGKNKTGAEMTLADEVRPRCLQPFSVYVPDVPAWEQTHGRKITDMVGKPCLIAVSEMQAANVGIGIKLQGEFGPDLQTEKASK
ncbi:MAG: hypothetical protein EOP83_14010 [Verrucomicrobiaceae bacterium]|nr:MAG: hypothetical protein EOP83_14010 [Verrucomicrobiaceae bacterium]